MFQACPFRGNDDSEDSKNQGNFKEMIKLLASYNKDVHEVVQNAPKMQSTPQQLFKRKLLAYLLEK